MPLAILTIRKELHGFPFLCIRVVPFSIIMGLRLAVLRAAGAPLLNFTITAEIHSRSLVNFYCQYSDRHMNLKFMRRVSERERAIRQFVIVKNKLMSVFNAFVMLLTMNFVITLSK